MRFLLELVLLGALVALAWEKSIRERVAEVFPAVAVVQKAGPVKRAAPAAASNTSGAWMWDPNRRTTLDRPAYDSRERPGWEVDEHGRRYRIDVRGRRQYEP